MSAAGKVGREKDLTLLACTGVIPFGDSGDFCSWRWGLLVTLPG
jgi:hypothetical protein